MPLHTPHRNTQKIKKVIKNIRTHSNNPKVFGYSSDFSSLSETRAMVAHLKRDLTQFFDGRLHCLINNAGVFSEDMHTTEDGLELTWAVNTAAPFLLTQQLLPLLTERVVNCSSISLADSLDLTNTQQELGYERMGHAAYGSSKLALNMWSYQLAERLKAAGSGVSVVCVDPGTVATKLLYEGWGEISHDIATKAEVSKGLTDEACLEVLLTLRSALLSRPLIHTRRRTMSSGRRQTLLWPPRRASILSTASPGRARAPHTTKSRRSSCGGCSRSRRGWSFKYRSL